MCIKVTLEYFSFFSFIHLPNAVSRAFVFSNALIIEQIIINIKNSSSKKIKI
jgi:hypothetical protein